MKATSTAATVFPCSAPSPREQTTCPSPSAPGERVRRSHGEHHTGQTESDKSFPPTPRHGMNSSLLGRSITPLGSQGELATHGPGRLCRFRQSSFPRGAAISRSVSLMAKPSRRDTMLRKTPNGIEVRLARARADPEPPSICPDSSAPRGFRPQALRTAARLLIGGPDRGRPLRPTDRIPPTSSDPISRGSA